jgi:hypothetical protein
MLKINQIIFIEVYHNVKIRDYLRQQFGERAEDYTEQLLIRHQAAGKLSPHDTCALAGLFNAFRFGWIYWTFFLDYKEPFDLEKAEADLQRVIRLPEELTKPAG